MRNGSDGPMLRNHTAGSLERRAPPSEKSQVVVWAKAVCAGICEPLSFPSVEGHHCRSSRDPVASYVGQKSSRVMAKVRPLGFAPHGLPAMKRIGRDTHYRNKSRRAF